MTQVQTPLHATRNPTRTRQLADIHALAAKAGFDTRGKEGDERRAKYEAFLSKIIGRTSTRQAVRSERERVLDELRRMTDAAYRLENARPVQTVSDAEAMGVLF